IPTGSESGVVFARDLEESIVFNYSEIENAEASRGTHAVKSPYVPLDLELEFIRGNYSEEQINSYIESVVKNFLVTYNTADEPHTYVDPGSTLDYSLTRHNNQFTAVINLAGIPRHPAQLYESVSCFILFFFLFYLWTRMKSNTPEGLFFGIFLIVIFGLRFIYE